MTDCDTDLGSDFRDQDRERHRGHSRKRSRHEDEASGDLDNCSKKKACRTESSREQSSKDRHKKMHRTDEKRTPRHHGEVFISLDDHWDGRSRTHDGNHSAERSEEVTYSHHTIESESFVHSNLASEYQMMETSNGKYYLRTYEHAKSGRRRPKKRSYSRGRECLSGEDSKVVKQNEYIGSIEKHGRRSSSGHGVDKDSDERTSHQYQEARNTHDLKSHFNGKPG